MASKWRITGVLTYVKYFDTQRDVKSNYTKYFDLNRKVQTREDELLGGPTLSVGWNVEPQLPLEVDDTNWEAGGNTWIWTVLDYDGRPEPYAEVHFDDRVTGQNIYRFNCDSRGRITLRIPDDILPGIYDFREIGPSMAPRTTKDVAIVDPWIVYKHGHRHSSSGPDPIYNITKEQISDDADIHPSQVAGAQSLGQLVDKYGTNIQEGLEKNISSGHGYFVVDGLNAGTVSGQSLTISAGVCWENSRLREVKETTVTFTQDTTYKIYVQNGIIRISSRLSFPSQTTPLYTVIVSNSLSNFGITDERLRHPESVSPPDVDVVRWGAENSDDLLHDGIPLNQVLNTNLNELRNRFIREDILRQEFLEAVEDSNKKIEDFEQARNKSSEVMLALGYSSTMKNLYSLFHKKTAYDLLLDNANKLRDAQLQDISNYLNSIYTGGTNLRSSHISAFTSGDELSSLTNLLIRNGIATLPNNWIRGNQYTLRTLRIEGPPATYLDFHLIYEETAADFRVLGSQSNSGRYIPELMTRIKLVKDDNLKSIFGTTRDCFIASYRVKFKNAGTESVIELLCKGGELPDGVRIRGFSIVTA